MVAVKSKNSSSLTIKMNKKAIFFKTDNFELLSGDSFKLVKKIEAKSIDFIFADPPYFLSSGGISCQAGKHHRTAESHADVHESFHWWQEYVR